MRIHDEDVVVTPKKAEEVKTYEPSCKHFMLHDDGNEKGPVYEEMKEHWHWIVENNSTPYLLTLEELVDLKLMGPENSRYNSEEIFKKVTYLIDYIDGPELNKENFFELTGNDTKTNQCYHTCKTMYLIDQYKTVGLYSTMQAVTESGGTQMFVHPGFSRIHAYYYMANPEDVLILWDNHNIVKDKTPLTFDEWFEIFDRIEGKNIFGANINGKIMEMHMEEDRPQILISTENIKDMFDRKPPVLIGECEEEVEKYFRTEGDKGVFFETIGDHKINKLDLCHILSLYPESSESFETENFKVYVK
tara:strand:- start:3831 stop:4742 length:912 start_codon:yes stop_codon:yes gene_type:complete